MIIPTNDEFFVARVYRRKLNSYEYEPNPYATFKCKIANNIEKKSYRIMKGVQGQEESIYLYASNMPKEINVDDRVEFLGEIKIVKSIGYYYNDSLFVNPSVFSSQKIKENCPKGLAVS